MCIKIMGEKRSFEKQTCNYVFLLKNLSSFIKEKCGFSQLAYSITFTLICILYFGKMN